MLIITIDGTENDHPGCHHIRRDGWLHILDHNDKLVTSYLEVNIRPDGVIADERQVRSRQVFEEVFETPFGGRP